MTVEMTVISAARITIRSGRGDGRRGRDGDRHDDDSHDGHGGSDKYLGNTFDFPYTDVYPLVTLDA